MLFIIVAFLMYPLVYIFSNSISDAGAVLRREVTLFPVGFSLRSFEQVLQHDYLPRSFVNAVIFTVSATAWSMLLTVLGAYPLSRKQLPGRNVIMLLITFTMLFSGGLIPFFLTVTNLGMFNSPLALIFPSAIAVFNLIILRTFFMQIPESLEESARLDGANDITILFRIFLPLSGPALATVGLFYFIGRWNDFFTPMIFLTDRSLFPLQVILRELLILATDRDLMRQGLAGAAAVEAVAPFGFQSAIIIVSILPLAIIYPFLQRYFVKGIMIGSVKG